MRLRQKRERSEGRRAVLIAYIMRGLPGSGKSTVARSLAGEDGAIHSTDDFFYVDGEYRFSPRRLREYHDRNFTAFCESLVKEVPVVICDNTNVKLQHFAPYLIAAQEAGYETFILTLAHPEPCDATARTLHNVPERAIRRMLHQWED